jgi:hypothetical protein
VSVNDDRFRELENAIALLRSYSRHRDFVRLALSRVAHELEARAVVHDASKMRDDEFAGFARVSDVGRRHEFGTPAYRAAIAREQATVDLHYTRNRHHAERADLIGKAAEASRGLPDDATYWQARHAEHMSFVDIIEMVCDWWGARHGYGDSNLSWADTVRVNLEAKGKHLSSHQLWLAREVAQFFSDEEAPTCQTTT